MKLVLSLIILFCISLLVVQAATIHGEIYDFSLEKVNGVRITVNTTPNQHQISKEGAYSFEIPNGFYELKAEHIQNNRIVALETRNVTVKQTGTYVIDFILFPNLDEVNELEDDIGVSFPESEERKLRKESYYFFVLILFLILFFVYRSRKGRKKVEKDNYNLIDKNEKESEADAFESKRDLDEILAIIKKEGGRTTQKEIRKHIPLSEAKISLMITELEHKGKIEKIKKGRGNIIVLKDK